MFQRALTTGSVHLALAAAAELRHVDLADALSPVLLIRDDDPLRFERAAVRWLSRYAADDRQLRLAEARELVDMLDGVGRHDQVAQLRVERLLRARGHPDAGLTASFDPADCPAIPPVCAAAAILEGPHRR